MLEEIHESFNGSMCDYVTNIIMSFREVTTLLLAFCCYDRAISKARPGKSSGPLTDMIWLLDAIIIHHQKWKGCCGNCEVDKDCNLAKKREEAVSTHVWSQTQTWLDFKMKIYKSGKRRSCMSWRLWTKRLTVPVSHCAAACERDLIESLRW